MQTVIETREFLRRAKECGVSTEERAEIVAFIAADPMAGDEMSGTGGARKIRFARPGQGKRGDTASSLFTAVGIFLSFY